MEILPCKRRKEEAAAEEEAWMSKVPEHILVELLIPAFRNSKFATQCKLVCKRWDSIISSVHFMRRCAAYHSRNLKSFSIILQWRMFRIGNPVVYLRPKDSEIVCHLNLEFIPSKFLAETVSESVTVKASSRDLLLLTYFYEYYVVNPKISQWISLPSPPTTPIPQDTYFVDGFLCEFDHCNGLRFKVMRMNIAPTSLISSEDRFLSTCGNVKEFSIQIYCSESKRWTEYTIDWYPFRLTHYLTETRIISHKGMFHWLNGQSIVSLNPFDLLVDNHVPSRLKPNRTVELPVKNVLATGVSINRVVKVGDRSGAFNRLKGFGVSRGHLLVITRCFQRNSLVDHPLLVWQLEKSKTGPGVGQGLWTLMHKVPVAELYPLWDYFVFLGFHPYEENSLFIQNFDCIYQVNLCTREFKEFIHHKACERHWRTAFAIPPLLHPWLPTQLTPSLLHSPAQ